MLAAPVLCAQWRALWTPRSQESVADWCCANLVFNEPKNNGPFSLIGREYAREPLDAFGEPLTSDMVIVTGSQAGKTGIIMGGAAHGIANNPMRCMWVMPNENKARSFSKKRWIPMLRASPTTQAMIPTGADRHDFAGLSQIIGSAIIDFYGSNSPTNLSSDPCQWVIQDETDKFAEESDREANAVNLADQRTKAQPLPKRIKTSTPSIREGFIWEALEKTDLRRRWVPCPHCGKFVVLAWSEKYTTFKLTGKEAVMRWDKEARYPTKQAGNGAGAWWDLERVARSAHMHCPHCDGKILERHKLGMDKAGEYRATQSGAPNHKGWHLPSLYVSSPETSFGKLSVKFLSYLHSLEGLRGFVNSELAEPWENQDTRGERIELVTDTLDSEEETEPIRIMAVDCQGKAPFFWHVVREFKDGDSIAISAGPLDTWEEVEEVQAKHNVPNVGTVIDSGFGARSDAEVYRTCAKHGELVGGYAIGWLPAKGQPSRKRWRDKKTGLNVPWYVTKIDPFIGTSQAGSVSMDLFEFAGDVFKDILEALRAGKGDHTWAVHTDVATDEYWRHMDGEVKTAVRNRKTGVTRYEWTPRSRHWPNHMLDCETMILAAANFLGLLDLVTKKE